MDKRHNDKISTHRIALFLTLIIFMLLVLGNAITFFVTTLLYFNGKFPSIAKQSFTGFLFYQLLLSTMISTALCFIMGRIPLSPVNHLIAGMSELANGNFSHRLKTNVPGEFRKIVRNFNIMAESLESTEILRNDFINNFSHEFKTPIVSIRGFAKILKDNTITQQERDEYLDIIISESTRLSTLANNVLNLSKIESQLSLTHTEPFNISEQIRKCILLLANRWEEKDIVLDIDLTEVEYNGSEELLTQIWVNLLDNAIKFTPEQGSIIIRLSQEKSSLVFQITDTGCGIAPEQQAHIFDKFYQCDVSHSSSGNGLGLSVVKKVIDLHHGNIVVDSIPEQGTTFTILLPILE